jgi:hypothetical protein
MPDSASHIGPMVGLAAITIGTALIGTWYPIPELSNGLSWPLAR